MGVSTCTVTWLSVTIGITVWVVLVLLLYFVYRFGVHIGERNEARRILRQIEQDGF